MRTVQLDDLMRAKLGDLEDEIALVDANGQIVACVVPPGHREMLYRLAANLFAGDEPVDGLQAYREGRCRTTAEVLARLSALAASEKVGA